MNKSIETRQFKMHPDLLFSVIKSQAGTHEKALLEAIMNTVDAGATHCQVTVTEKGYEIVDDGRGFASRDEIENFFETFGTPHVEGDATYGKFRMGRGQLFAFSRTLWHSNQFKMDVCIKTRGLDYQLKDDEKPFPGCKIKGTWHEKLKGSELLTIMRDLKMLVKYMQIPVFLNKEEISVKAAEQKWDVEIPEAYIKVAHNTGVLSVYNLGALVAHYPASKFGIGGVVVSREALAVNFARNDVLVSQCRVWRKIASKMNELLGIETKKKTVLTNDERIALVNQLLEGTLKLSQVFKKGLLTDVNSKKPTFDTLFSAKRLSFSSGLQKFRNVEEKIQDQGLALVLDKTMLDRFMVNTPAEFIKKINELVSFNNKMYNEELYKRNQGSNHKRTLYHMAQFKPTLIAIEELHTSFNSLNIVKNKDKYTKKETCIIKALHEASKVIARAVAWHLKEPECPRKIELGLSEVANAWTDGQSYIAFSDKFLAKANGAMNIVMTMVHEYCHTTTTLESHSHGLEFYELYHDITIKNPLHISYAIEMYNRTLVKELVKANIKPHSKLERDIEKMEKYQEHESFESIA